MIADALIANSLPRPRPRCDACLKGQLAAAASARLANDKELVQCTGRTVSNLSRTLKTMESYGFVGLHRGARAHPGGSSL